MDYFPVPSDFLNSLMVRRVLRDHGSESVMILLNLLCEVYGGEGYYLEVNDREVEDIALNFPTVTPEDIYRVIDIAIERGFFDDTIYREKHILTSADIQRVYVVAKRKNKRKTYLREDILLLSPETEEKDNEPAHANYEEVKTDAEMNETEATVVHESSQNEVSVLEEKVSIREERVSILEEKGAKREDFDENGKICAQRKEKKRKGNKREENLLLNPPPGMEEDLPKMEEEGSSLEKKPSGEHSVPDKAAETAPQGGCTAPQKGGPSAPQGEQTVPAAPPKGKRPPVTREMISALVPPNDGRKRNLKGLIEAMTQHRIEPEDQYAIICKSNYGLIGHPVWKALYKLHECGGRIHLPGKFVLSY